MNAVFAQYETMQPRNYTVVIINDVTLIRIAYTNCEVKIEISYHKNWKC